MKNLNKQDNFFLKKAIFISLFILFSINLINIYCYIFHYDGYIGFCELYFSRDNYIGNPLRAFVLISAVLIYFLFLNIYLYFKYESLKNSYHRLNKLNKIFIIIIFFLFLIHLVSKITWQTGSVFENLYTEDNLLENFTVLFTLIASYNFIKSTSYIKSKFEKFIALFASIMLIFFIMEEISWGQRFFNFETPTFINEINLQNETNFHNILNKHFYKLFYPIFNFTMSLFLIFSIYFRRNIIDIFKSEKYARLLPSLKFEIYILIFYLLIFNSLWHPNGGELTEQIFSIFILMYSIDQLYILKFKK